METDMADKKTDDTAGAEAPKKKKKGKLILFIGLPVLLLGGGGGAAAYTMGWLSAAPADHAEEAGPKLVPKSEEKRASASGAGGEGGEHGGGEGGEEAAAESHGGKPTPKGEGGDKYASNYYAMEKEFTANLRESVHFVQVGLAISTPYDDTVLDNIKTHEIAIRSAILMSLADTSEDEVFTPEGKKGIQDRLAKAINGVLKQKEGFGGVSNVYFTNFIVQ
jgi:flagellar protein FliL